MAADLGFAHRFVAPSPEGSAVTLLLLHGTGGNEDDLLPLGHELLKGSALLSPRGKVLEQGMPRFFRRLSEGVFDLEDLKVQTADLGRFIGEAARQYQLEDSRIVAVGYSNGANIAGSLLLTHPKLLAGALLFRPMVPFRPNGVPDLKDVPVFLGPGCRDPIVSPAQTSELAKLLEASGARVSVHFHEGGHELGRDDLTAAKQWLAQFAAQAP